MSSQIMAVGLPNPALELPVNGSSAGLWGILYNNFGNATVQTMKVEHTENGSHKNMSIYGDSLLATFFNSSISFYKSLTSNSDITTTATIQGDTLVGDIDFSYVQNFNGSYLGADNTFTGVNIFQGTTYFQNDVALVTANILTANTSLIITNLAGTPTLVFNGSANGNSFFNSGGNVGIGTTTPKSTLEVLGNTNIIGDLNASDIFLNGVEVATVNDLTGGNITITSAQVIKNVDSVTIIAGTPMYFTGYNSGLDVQEAIRAGYESTNTHADCVASETIGVNNQGQCVTTGKVYNADTSDYLFGDNLYLNSTGTLTKVKPIDVQCVQKIGSVLRSHATQGRLWISGANRCNDVGSLVNVTGSLRVEDNTLFADASKVGIGTTSPQTTLDVAGTGNFSILQVAGVPVLTYSGFSATNITSGTIADARIDSAITRDTELSWNTTGTDYFLSQPTYNVGIGTTAPLTPLHVVGNFTIGTATQNASIWHNGSGICIGAC
ncbi:MAG: hypothetical protein U9O94_08475 [Nanoarchaeota archaeon]|nr:hypothetical protein [Nanoarchaeota archaeon]